MALSRRVSGTLPRGAAAARLGPMHAYDQVDAELFDCYALGVPGDLEFFCEQALSSGGPVLELGCGTGRVALALAASGVEVIGIDAAPAMLERARHKLHAAGEAIQRRVRLIEGDVCQLPLVLARNGLGAARFPLVLFPFRGFQHLYEVGDQLAALAALKDCLTPEGRFIFNVFDPKPEYLAEPPDLAKLELEFCGPAGQRMMLWVTRHFDAERQCLEQQFIFETLDALGRVTERCYSGLSMRYFFRFEMQHLIERAGLRVLDLYGDFWGGPFVSGGEQLWICGR